MKRPGAASSCLTAKPVLYVCNVDEASAATGNAFSGMVEERATAEGAGVVVISAKIEAELAGLDSRRARRAFLADLGLEEPGLNRLIREGYNLSHLRHLFHRRPQGGARLDDHAGHQGPESRRRHPHRLDREEIRRYCFLGLGMGLRRSRQTVSPKARALFFMGRSGQPFDRNHTR